MVQERKEQKEKLAVEVALRAKREEEARWHNVPEWKKLVIEKQAKKLQVRHPHFTTVITVTVAQMEQQTNPDLIAMKEHQLLKERILKLPPWQQELLKKKHGITDLTSETNGLSEADMPEGY